MQHRYAVLAIIVSSCVIGIFANQSMAEEHSDQAIWPQWRGPARNGKVGGQKWPDRLNSSNLKELWRVPLDPSYSGPIVSQDLVFTTETRDKKSERVYALDRTTGKERWHSEWKGAMTVPFFAASNGSWIRSTPAFDGERLYVGGMCDLLVCLDAKSGQVIWQLDFVKQFHSPLPAFGLVCSPLIDENSVYLQAGASVVRLNKKTGDVIWRSLKDEGGMNGSAFSSPVIAKLAGKRQLVVQTREKLVGLSIEDGSVLWTQAVPAFRGMNVLTPIIFDDGIFTSTYQNRSFLYKLASDKQRFLITEKWNNNAQGYMSTPVVIGDHAYMHLQNQRFTCINLKTGERMWSSKPFGKYSSLVAQGDRILALDERGILLFINANPKQFDLIDSQKVSDEETWAHLAVCGDELFVRSLKALVAYRWR